MPRAATSLSLLCLVLVGSLSPTASFLDFPPIGIDLGTTYSRAAVYQDSHVVIIPDDEGNRATPSQVAFTDGGGRLVGEAAEDQQAANTIYGTAKRLLGWQFSDEAVQREIELLPTVVDNDGRPYVQVQVGDGGDEFFVLSPEEIVAEVFAKLKGTAEAFLGRNVTTAVVTVPAYYNDAQWQATKDAGVTAGLEVIRIIKDPIAAASAYGLEKKGYDLKTLVFDLGGSTSDATVMNYEDFFFDVLSISGDSHLGGQDFDQRVTDHFVELIKQKHGQDITGDSRALRRLRRECERAKRELSNQDQARVEIEALFDGVDFLEPLTRAQFEDLNEDLFLKAMARLEKAIADAGLDKRKIDHIILTGGSTRIPKVQQLVKDYFDGKEPYRGIHPDEAMAFGAAVHGSILSGHHEEEQRRMDRYPSWSVPLSIGIETDNGKMTQLIPRDPTWPTRKTHVLTTFWDKRSTVTVKVFEGERKETKDCRFMGQLELSGIPTASIWNWGRRDIEVTLEVDEYGELRVAATDKRSGRLESAIIRHSGRLSPEEIDRMVREAEAWTARDKLEAYVRSVMDEVGDAVDGKMDPEEEERVDEAVSKAREWFDDNPVVEKEDFEEMLRELTEVCDPVVLAVQQRFPSGHDDDDEL